MLDNVMPVSHSKQAVVMQWDMLSRSVDRCWIILYITYQAGIALFHPLHSFQFDLIYELSCYR